MPPTYHSAANPPPLAVKDKGDTPLHVPVVAFLSVSNKSPLILVVHPHGLQHAQFTARVVPLSVLILIAPEDVRPRVKEF